MITVLQLLDQFIMINQLLSVGESNCVHTLKIVIVIFGEPVGGTNFGALKGLDVGGAGDVRTGAEID